MASARERRAVKAIRSSATELYEIAADPGNRATSRAASAGADAMEPRRRDRRAHFAPSAGRRPRRRSGFARSGTSAGAAADPRRGRAEPRERDRRLGDVRADAHGPPPARPRGARDAGGARGTASGRRVFRRRTRGAPGSRRPRAALAVHPASSRAGLARPCCFTTCGGRPARGTARWLCVPSSRPGAGARNAAALTASVSRMRRGPRLRRRRGVRAAAARDPATRRTGRTWEMTTELATRRRGARLSPSDRDGAGRSRRSKRSRRDPGKTAARRRRRAFRARRWLRIRRTTRLAQSRHRLSGERRIDDGARVSDVLARCPRRSRSTRPPRRCDQP